MAIYISGNVCMPKGDGSELIIRVLPDGTVLNAVGINLRAMAVEVQPHGVLKDADELGRVFCEKGQETGGLGGLMAVMAAKCIDSADTIIPADPEEGEAARGGESPNQEHSDREPIICTKASPASMGIYSAGTKKDMQKEGRESRRSMEQEDRGR